MIGSEYAPDRYIGNDSTTVFSYNFKIVDESHLRVVIADANDENEAVLVKDTHYTMTGVGEDAGGNITLLDIRSLTGESVVQTLPTGWSITLKIDIPLKQLTNYHNQGGYFAETHEDSFDLLTQLCQQLQEELNRALKVSETSGDSGASLDEDFASILADTQAARDAAAVSETNAGVSETNAAASESAASTSASNASTSETNAAASAAAASASAAASLTEWRFGSGAPSAGLGIDGDNYMDTATDEIYHKETGSWVLKGDVTGATGSAGSDGQTILTGSVAPTGGDGTDGDYWIDNVAWNIYGPKAAGVWPSAQSIIGPAGAGSGDVLGPATHADGKIPLWDGVNSKTLKEGLSVSGPLAITSGNLAMSFNSTDFSTSGDFALSATGITAGTFGSVAGGQYINTVNVDAGGRVSSVVVGTPAGGSGFNWTTENAVTTNQSPTTGDLGEAYRYTPATAADRTITLPSVGSGEDGDFLAIINDSEYTITVTASDSDTIGWPALVVGSAEITPNALVVLRYNHADTKWQIASKEGNGQVRPEGTVMYVTFDRANYAYVNGADVNAPICQTRRNGFFCNPDNPSSLIAIDAASGKFGYSYLQLDGVDGYCGSVASADWDIFGSTSGDVTVCGWVYCDTLSAAVECIITQYEDASNFWYLRRETSGALGVSKTTGGSADVSGTGGTIIQSTWHHVALCKVGAETGIYVDGSQVAYDATFTADTFAGSLYLGQNGASGDYFDGRMDDWAIVYSNIFNAAPNSTPDDTFSLDTNNPLGLVI